MKPGPGRAPEMKVPLAARVERMPRYDEGLHGEEARRRYALDDIAKLASNESPDPPSAAVVEAIARAAQTINLYPDTHGVELRGALADRFGVGPERVALGSGGNSLLYSVADAVLEPGADAVFPAPSFALYPHLPARTGARAVPVPLDTSGHVDFDGLEAAVTGATRLVIVCNPMSPTATCSPVADIARLVERLPDSVLVVVDQAYVEYQEIEDPDAALALIDRFANVALLRTFSKVYGLCGLRVGYLICSTALRAAIDRVRVPFAVNTLALAAAVEALRHPEDVERRVAANARERAFVLEGVRGLGLSATDSETNFAWIDLAMHDERAVVESLARRGVIVRAGSALGAPGHLRVTFGRRWENERFLEALGAALEGAAGGAGGGP